jgi:hypothetical protein
MQEDDLTLLRHYADYGNQAAFAEVVRRNMNFVYSSALRRVGGDAHWPTMWLRMFLYAYRATPDSFRAINA